MKLNIHPSWKNILEPEMQKPYFRELTEFISAEYSQNTCFPESDVIFEAFNRATLDRVKVVIIGQDPYHGPNQAHGLCFSVKEGVKVPPSLINIYKELESDLDKPFKPQGNLEHWANQGVLLLNAVLTVRANSAGSHQKKGWETFTNRVIELISENKENVVFLLWGGYAKKKGAKIDSSKHLVLTAGHPSPLSAIRGHWFGNKHFSKTNEYLIENGMEPIDW
ncbi:uracil-DNA glycosylase [Antarcticibacterium arcticum]|uniref:Uracil-DNA glycosylase n=1 Tax=Antarcticibacterium arcticum TaxID=2585771 RepID=A0A5B8YG99_9FLAO|nr:uracil-DNA glycosylase [Antarcticibacterium arcticum]QED36955.1 uracil-DNA glycosylase [Antarcticibacterium arcticum]